MGFSHIAHCAAALYYLHSNRIILSMKNTVIGIIIVIILAAAGWYAWNMYGQPTAASVQANGADQSGQPVDQSGQFSSTTVTTTTTTTTTGTSGLAAAGEHCGGNMATAKQCIAGYRCAPDPASHLPFGDVGGSCVKN
jgi:hypothetical protein